MHRAIQILNLLFQRLCRGTGLFRHRRFELQRQYVETDQILAAMNVRTGGKSRLDGSAARAMVGLVGQQSDNAVTITCR